MRISDWSSDVCSSDLSLRIEQDLGFATLTAVCSYTEKKADLAFDNSIFNGYDPRTDTPELASSVGKSKTEYGELRLASPDSGRFRWLLGANYTRLRSNNTDGTFIEGIADFIDANPGEFPRQPSSEERRVGQECGGTCQSWWSPYH